MENEDIFDGVNVTVSGIHDEDEFMRSKVNEEISHAVKKLGSIVPLSGFVMHVRKYHETGNKKKYSVQARLVTEEGNFFSDDYAWDLTKAVKGALDKLEREVTHKSGKEKDRIRGP